MAPGAADIAADIKAGPVVDRHEDRRGWRPVGRHIRRIRRTGSYQGHQPNTSKQEPLHGPASPLRLHLRYIKRVGESVAIRPHQNDFFGLSLRSDPENSALTCVKSRKLVSPAGISPALGAIR